MGNKRWKNVNQRTLESTFHRMCPKAKITFTFIEHALKQRSKFGDPVNSACKGQGQFRPICCFVSTQVHESATIISNSILATIMFSSAIFLPPVYYNVNEASLWFWSILQPAFAKRYWAIYLFCDLSHIGFQDKRETFVIRTSSIGSTKACKESFRKCSFLNICFTIFRNKISLQDIQRRPFLLNPFNMS